jgi:Zn-dependent protease
MNFPYQVLIINVRLVVQLTVCTGREAMNQRSIPLGRFYNIPVGIDTSWFLIYILFTWSLATSYFPSEYKNWSTGDYWFLGALTAMLFFGSVLLHELAHSLVSLRFNIPVRRITLYIFGGLSELVSEPPTAGAKFWISLAGPVMNLVLAGFLAGLSLIAEAITPLLAILKYLAYINLLLGVFNLLPGFPLDGGHMLMALIWQVTGKKHWGVLTAARVGVMIAYLFILVGGFELITGSQINGIWSAFMGWFLLNASGTAIRREKLQELLTGHKAAEAMNRAYTVIYGNTSLQSLVDEHILGSGKRSFIVKQDETVVGLLTLHAFRQVSKDAWPTTLVEQVMIPSKDFKQIGPDTEIWDALVEMDRDGVNQLPVMADGQIQGMLTREDVITYLRSMEPTRKSGN